MRINIRQQCALLAAQRPVTRMAPSHQAVQFRQRSGGQSTHPRLAVRSQEDGAWVEEVPATARLAESVGAAAEEQPSSPQEPVHHAGSSNGAAASSLSDEAADQSVASVSSTSSSTSSSSLEAAPPPQLPLVPWGMNTTITVMVVWLVGFWLAAYMLVPCILSILQVDVAAAAGGSSRVQALRHLLLDVLQLGSTLLLLSRALRDFKPRQLGLFRIEWRPVRRWAPVLLAGCATFPVVDWVHKNMVALLSGPALAGSGSASLVAGGDWAARAMWFAVLAVCAPVWEEIMFRGFLLPSLARRLPIPVAVGATSLAFALVHFTYEGFLPLLMLGIIFGTAYVRTRNLLPSMLLHSLWNVCLLAQIIFSGGAL